MSDLVVGVVTRSQSQSHVEDGDEVQEPSAEAPADIPVPPVRARVRRHGARLPATKDIVRHSRAAKASTEWTDTSFMLLPDEPEDYDLDDVDDLITNERDSFVAAQEEIEHAHTDLDSPDDEPLPAPLTREEIIEAQDTDEYFQGLLQSQVGRRGSPFFVDSGGVLCRRPPMDRFFVQIVLPVALRPRVLRLGHYHVTTGHPGQYRMFQRLRRTYYWPQIAADKVSTVRECTQCSKNRLRLILSLIHISEPTRPY